MNNNKADFDDLMYEIELSRTLIRNNFNYLEILANSKRLEWDYKALCSDLTNTSNMLQDKINYLGERIEEMQEEKWKNRDES
ncbi:hypothetical protein PS406_06575 [Pediococcus acidilactici]